MDPFKKKIEDISALHCMVVTKRGPNYAPDSEIFVIHGTRIFLIVKKVFQPFSSFNFSELLITQPTLAWREKSKNKKEYKAISFEEVLDHPHISDKAKSEIVFNLDVFLNRE
jgi:hypothetical protein